MRNQMCCHLHDMVVCDILFVRLVRHLTMCQTTRYWRQKWISFSVNFITTPKCIHWSVCAVASQLLQTWARSSIPVSTHTTVQRETCRLFLLYLGPAQRLATAHKHNVPNQLRCESFPGRPKKTQAAFAKWSETNSSVAEITEEADLITSSTSNTTSSAQQDSSQWLTRIAFADTISLAQLWSGRAIRPESNKDEIRCSMLGSPLMRGEGKLSENTKHIQHLASSDLLG